MVGDSIAVGVGQARPECETIAKVGITSERYIVAMLPAAGLTAETAVISLGVNDDDSLDTLENLRLVRAKVRAQSVIWLLPGLKERARSIIRTVAEEHGDRLIDTRPQAGRDHLHPTGAGYQVIAAQTMGDGSQFLPADEANEVAAYAPPSHRRAMATPRDRIRGLRALRQAERGTTHPTHGHARSHTPAQPRTALHAPLQKQRVMRVSVHLTPPAAPPHRAHRPKS